ncbi:MAG TPA: hypothetical protein VJW94_19580 [Candidatus Acidoferrum sp.]|nr:hypothetical protein [Candidatus Acidoferrum sp.]
MGFRHIVAIGDGKPALYADISEAESYAIGKMTTGWAILEHLMMVVTITKAKTYKQPLPPNFLTIPFDVRFKIFRQMVSLVKARRGKAHLENVVSRIANVQAERHDFTRGIWDWDYKAPHKVKVDHARKKGRTYKKYDSDAILGIARRIAEINFDLLYPRGINQFYMASARAVTRTGFSMSRKFAVAISGAESKDPSLTEWPAVPPELQEAMAKLAEAGSREEPPAETN